MTHEDIKIPNHGKNSFRYNMSIKGIRFNRCVWSYDPCLVLFKVPTMVSVPIFIQVSLLSVTYKVPSHWVKH